MDFIGISRADSTLLFSRTDIPVLKSLVRSHILMHQELPSASVSKLRALGHEAKQRDDIRQLILQMPGGMARVSVSEEPDSCADNHLRSALK